MKINIDCHGEELITPTHPLTYQSLSAALKAVADPNKLKIIKALVNTDQDVTLDFCLSEIHMNESQARQALDELSQSGIIFLDTGFESPKYLFRPTMSSAASMVIASLFHRV